MAAFPHVEFNGHKYYLAAIPSSPRLMARMPAWSSAQPTIPRSEWKERSGRGLGVPILDQNGFGSCVGHGGGGAMMSLWRRQGGPPVMLSSCFLYGNINGGRDQGASIIDAMQSLQSQGICLESEVPEGNIYSSRFPKSSYATAKNFILEDAYTLASFDEIGTAQHLGWDVVYGIAVGNSFPNLNGDGIAPAFRGYANHCMRSDGLKYNASRGMWMFDNVNSWSRQFGLDGRCYLTEDHFSRVPQLEAFAVRSLSMADQFDARMPSVAA